MNDLSVLSKGEFEVDRTIYRNKEAGSGGSFRVSV